MKLFCARWTISLVCLAATFGAVYCEEPIDMQPLSLFDDIVESVGPSVMALLAMDYVNTTNPADVGYQVKRTAAADSSVQNSVDCGIQNGDSPFKKIYDSNDGGRIIGGTDAYTGEFPWQVSVQGKFVGAPFHHKCGGSIVSEKVVVTAGHCLYGEDPEDLQIVAGASDIFHPTGNEQARLVKTYFSKFYFSADTPMDDIAVLILEKPLVFDKGVSPVCLPKSGSVYNGTQGIVTGWGFVSEAGRPAKTLQVVQLPIIPREKCRTIYQVPDGPPIIKVNECNICAGSFLGGKDSCQGDSGGPMTCVEDDGRHQLCGVVSWGIGCGRAGSPGVYTSTSCYSDWIQKLIAKYNSIA